jgi:hypothetical protein
MKKPLDVLAEGLIERGTFQLKRLNRAAVIAVFPWNDAPRRRHAKSVPDALKNRPRARKSRQETGRQDLYDSLKTGAQVSPVTSPVGGIPVGRLREPIGREQR